MGSHFTYFHSLIENLAPTAEKTVVENIEKLALAGALAATMVVLAKAASSRISTPEGIEEHLVPRRFSLTGFFDLVLSGFVAYHDSILGKENRRYMALSGSVFLFILFSNLLGLIPGFAAITTTVWVNLAMAFVVFFAFNFYGIREHGLINYFKHFLGPVWWLAPFFFCLEILSTCLRVFTLNLRLYWNITVDHLLLGIFTDLVPYIVPIALYALGTFVSFMQAFVFTTLTMVYILLAVQHGEEEHH